MLGDEPRVPASVGSEDVVRRVGKLDESSVWENYAVPRPLFIWHQKALAAADREEWKSKLGKLIPERSFAGRIEGLESGFDIEPLADGRSAPAAAEQSLWNTWGQDLLLGDVVADRK
jgi:hypothetical protein